MCIAIDVVCTHEKGWVVSKCMCYMQTSVSLRKRVGRVNQNIRMLVCLYYANGHGLFNVGIE